MTDFKTDCPLCNGQGWISHDQHCPECDGTGEVDSDRFFDGADRLHDEAKDNEDDWRKDR